MKCITIKLEVSEKPKHLTENQVVDGLLSLTQDPMNYLNLSISKSVDLKKLKSILEDKFECTVRDGVTEGCYGSSSGRVSKGLTVYMHPKKLVDRYVQTNEDGEKTEFVNPWFLLSENAEMTELDGEAFEDWSEALGHDLKADNTYNYSTDFGSLKSEHAAFMFDFQFSTLELKNGGALVSVMFHCGGDPRGNYTTKHVFKFKYLDDFYSVVFPGLRLLSEEES